LINKSREIGAKFNGSLPRFVIKGRIRRITVSSDMQCMAQNISEMAQPPQLTGNEGKYWRTVRLGVACFLAILVLGVMLPSVGGIFSKTPTHLRMWQVGPFSFFPGPFFTIVGLVGGCLALAVFGTIRRNACQGVSLFLLGLLFVCALFCVA
jgi:hypothetical protein